MASRKESPGTSGSGQRVTARAAGGRAHARWSSRDQRVTTATRSDRRATSASFQPEPARSGAKLVIRERAAHTAVGRARQPIR
ncbi:hypothetical protein GA0115255_113781 [Streptomyces sp. Ncost-T6T-2b]|nr:hypothetical protein GA0115255_113781 [Streptomyces sp. Ncost-T6T-2b]